MTIDSSELLRLKSSVVSDADANGGLMDNNAEVTSGVVNNIWPNVQKAERDVGSTKYRKTFWKVADSENGTLLNALAWIDLITEGDDWVVLFEGTQTDTQVDIAGSEDKFGAGALQANVLSGVSSFVVTVEDVTLTTGNDVIFRDGESIIITNKDTPGAVSGTSEEHVISGTPTVSSNDVTITIVGTLANAYNTDDNTYGTRIASSIDAGDLVAEAGTLVITTAGDGSYDDTTYPIITDNIGAIDQTVTLTFTDAVNFTAASDVAGVSLSGGSTAADYDPDNPDVSYPYFTIESGGWTGTWASGDTLEIPLTPAAVAIWEKRVVPAGSGTLNGNRVRVALTGESV